MEFSFSRTQFRDAFAKASAPTPTRTNIETLKYVHATATSNYITLVGTDMESTVQVKCLANSVPVAGSCLLPVDKIRRILSETEDEIMSLSLSNGKVLVYGSRDRFTLQAPEESDFPVFKPIDFSNGRKMQSALLAQALRRTMFAADDEGTRYALGGVLVDPGDDGGSLTFVGTDGRRLSRFLADPVGSNGTGVLGDSGTGFIIIPHRNIKHVLGILGDDTTVDIAADNNSIGFKCGDSTAVLRLLEGRFPRWKDVVPNTKEYNSVDIPAGQFRGSLRRSSITSNTETRGVSFAFDVGTLTLSAAVADVGATECTIPVTCLCDPVKLTLDVDYMAEAMADIAPESNVTMFFKDHEKAVVVSTGNDWLYVVMPMSSS